MKRTIFLLFLCTLRTTVIDAFVLMFYLPTDTKGGRIIDGEFEKDILSVWARVLQDQLTQTVPSLEVIILGQTEKEYDQTKLISQANRLNPDLIISLNLFQTQTRPQLFMYHVLLSKEPFSSQNSPRLLFLPYEQAYMKHAYKSTLVGGNIYASLKMQTKEAYELKSFLGIPYKPLMGLLPPALGIELGSTNAKSWELTVPSLTEALRQAIYSIQGE